MLARRSAVSLTALFVAVAAPLQAATDAVELSPVFVTATRTAEAAKAVPFSNETFTAETIRFSPNVTVDGMLRRIPGFSLFRRSDSLVANPTTQGVSLRGLGPSGASRSLILLDGVPLNDPFGGWVLWSKVPRESLARIEVVPGAGGTAWGNAALGGVIQLFTEPALGSRRRLAARAGDFNTLDVEAQLTEPVGTGTLQVLGRSLSTDGYHTVAREHRGPIDVPASSRSRWVTARWRQPVAANTTATLTARRFAEARGNGTPYQRNSSDETFASLLIAAQPAASFQWNATAYAQSQNFTSTFSAVNPTRTAETPASNQFAVPATTVGFAWVGEWSASTDARTTAGFDVRDVRGETRENSAFVDGAFTRLRFAGGRQTTAGVFVVHSRPVADARTSFGLRADGWQETDGHRRDYLLGAPVGDVTYPRRDGVELSPSAGVVWPLAGPLRVHASAQQAFRRPTLNELYRAFRVGNVITDGNPELRTETVTSGEIGLTAIVGRGGSPSGVGRGLPTPPSSLAGDASPSPNAANRRGRETAPYNRAGVLTLGVTGFWNELHDSVANVTIAPGPVTLPGIGFVPAGGEGRRKHNLDRTRVRGIALEADWTLTSSLRFDGQYMYNDARVTRAGIAPWLGGKRLAQVPGQSASAGVTWERGRWAISPRVRWLGEQFEDDNNRLRLAGATVVDVSMSVTLGRGGELFVSVENLFDRRIETGRAATGLVNTGTPRLILAGFRIAR